MNSLFSLSNFVKNPFFFLTTRNEQASTFPKKELVLSDIFECREKYEIIRQIFIEQGFITPDSTAWIDSQKGYKQLIIVILKYLQIQGYYHQGKKLSATEIQEISFNTFGIEIGIDHIKHTCYKDQVTDFIPPAASLKEREKNTD